MSAVYAESSAVLRWLLGTPDARKIQRALRTADDVIASTLTAAEVGRTLHRLEATGVITPTVRRRAWLRYSRAAAHWHHFAVTDEVLRRAGDPFPAEPVRTLDAIHLATAELYSALVVPVGLLSVDSRIRDNATALGLRLLPR